MVGGHGRSWTACVTPNTSPTMNATTASRSTQCVQQVVQTKPLTHSTTVPPSTASTTSPTTTTPASSSRRVVAGMDLPRAASTHAQSARHLKLDLTQEKFQQQKEQQEAITVIKLQVSWRDDSLSLSLLEFRFLINKLLQHSHKLHYRIQKVVKNSSRTRPGFGDARTCYYHLP